MPKPSDSRRANIDAEASLDAPSGVRPIDQYGFTGPPDARDYSTAQYDVMEERGVLVTMRDGARLSTDIYSPRTTGRLPAILGITPYDNDVLRADARWFASRGYVVVAADSRGRYDSDGTFDPFDSKHKTDGYDLVEWIAGQPWSNGKVGMIGGSYGAWTQWWTASTAPPHLAAIAPIVAPPDPFENVPYQNGVLTGGNFTDWCALIAGRTRQAAEDGVYGGWPLRRHALSHTPYIDINAHRGMRNAPWFHEVYRHNKSTDPYWEGIAYQRQDDYARMTVPSLSITGWFDENHPGTPMNYVGMTQFAATAAARRPHMIIGPWTHGINTRAVGSVDFGPEATIDVNGYICRWFDHFLKGIDNEVASDAPVYVFVMGANRWRAALEWPLPQAQLTKYYFDSNGHANSLKGDGVLTTTAPGVDGRDCYTYDPRRPTRDPFDGHASMAISGGPADTRLSAIEDSVLVYQTPPLESAVEVVGPIEAVLYASTSARDTDWFVRLVDVQPDGYSRLLAEGAMRARNRDPAQDGEFNAAQLSVIEPGRVYRYVIRFWRGTANLFQRQHRIRVEISSSWYPSFLPNLNAGADNLALVSMCDAVVAEQIVHHGPRHTSHIVLPVIPAEHDHQP
jgi:hypothetical protein